MLAIYDGFITASSEWTVIGLNKLNAVTESALRQNPLAATPCFSLIGALDEKQALEEYSKLKEICSTVELYHRTEVVRRFVDGLVDA